MSDQYDVMCDVMLVVLGLVGRNGDVESLLLDGRCMVRKTMNLNYGLVELRIVVGSLGGRELMV